MKKDLESVRNFVGKGKIFSVTFIKKDNTVRKMNCIVGVKKHLKGGEQSYNPSEKNLLTVYDVKSKGYRMINISTLLELKANKQTISFV